MAYRKLNFDEPIDHDVKAVAVFDPCPDWGSITYLDGSGNEVYYEFADEADYNKISGRNSATTSLTLANGVKITCGDIVEVQMARLAANDKDYFCYHCDNLRKLTFAKNVTKIGAFFLNYCASFNQPIEFPMLVNEIGKSFLSYCSEFNQPITVPEGVKTIEGSFLIGCTSFNSKLTLPEGLESIDTNFLSQCYAFNQPLTIPSTVKSIGNGFIAYLANSNKYMEFNSPLIYEGEGLSISSYFLTDCRYFNDPSITEFLKRVTHINNASSSNDGLLGDCCEFNQPLDFSNVDGDYNYIGLLRMGSSLNGSAFNSPIKFSPKAKVIGSYVLQGCRSFNQPIDIPDSVETIGYGFLANCQAFNQSIHLPKNLVSIDDNFMHYCNAFNQPLELPDGVKTLGNRFFASPVNGSTVINQVYNQPITIPDTVTSIGSEFLSGLAVFNSPLKLSKNLISLGYNFLYNCKAFDQDVTIPAGITAIDNQFMRQTDMSTSKVTFEGTVKTIGTYFLAQTNYNAELPFKEGLEEIGTYCLYAASKFNQPINFPSTLKKISFTYFLYAAYDFNQPIDWDFLNTVDCGDTWTQSLASCYNYDYPIKVPRSIVNLVGFGNSLLFMDSYIVIHEGVSVTSGNFMYQSRTSGYDPATSGFIGTVIFESENPVFTTTSANVLGASDASMRTYIEGIKIAGPGAESVKAQFPDQDDKAPFRKLIIVDDPRD